MTLVVSCPQCQTRRTLDDRWAGKKIRCKRCKQPCVMKAEPGPTVPPVFLSPLVVQDASPAPSTPSDASRPNEPGREEQPQVNKKRRWSRILGWSLGAGLLGVAGLFFLLFLLTPSTVDQQLEDLRAGGPQTRARALLGLAQADPEEAYRAKVTAALEPLLYDGDVARALKPDLLLRAYLRWADRDNVPALIRMVENPTLPFWSPAKTGRVLETLGKLQDERAVEVIAERLSDVSVRAQAVTALQLMGPRAEPVVLEYLFDPSPGTRLRASRLLADYGTRPAAITAEALRRLRSSQDDVRRSSLVWFIDHPPSDAKQKAQAAKLLAGFLEDLSPQIDAQALQALQLWATKDSLPALVAFARREARAREGDPILIDVLAQFRDETAAEAIALQLKNVAQRDKAVQALVKLGRVAAGAVLGYLNHPDPGVQKEARGLCRLLQIPAGRQIEQTLTDLADTRVPRTRAALQYLARLRPDPACRARVSRALNAPLLDPNPGVAEDALKAVTVWGSKENTATLLKILGDPQRQRGELQAHVIEVLGALKDPAAAPALAQGLTNPRDGDLVARALKAIGPAAEGAVIPFLQSRVQGARIEACWILAEIGTVNSLPPLKAALDAYALDNRFVQEVRLACQKITVRK